MTVKFYIGTSGWSYKHWKGTFFPESIQPEEWLHYYSSSFNTVEVNTTFYRAPVKSVVKSWFKKTPEDFTFTLKAPQNITHSKKLSGIERSLSDFYRLMKPLEHKAKCVLFQLPPTFQYTEENSKKIENLLGLLNSKYDHVMEFRHNSWWRDECYKLLKDRCGFCTVNGLDMPPDIGVTNNSLYLRFHGNKYNSLYTDAELETYADQLPKIIKANKIEKVYIYFNNDLNGYAVQNGSAMEKIIADKFKL
jgi:uncharacterized protein YecE (DUF72 family)